MSPVTWKCSSVSGPRFARRALITGGTGFIGSRLSCRLARDQWTVHVVTRPGSDVTPLDPVRDSLTLHVHDGSTEALSRILDDAKPSVVFHLAAMALAQHHISDIIPLLSANVVFGTQLVEAMAAAKVHCLVNTGTFWQHYAGEAYSPTCLYAATKQAFESLLQYYVEVRGLRAISLVLYDTYGPHDPRPKLFNLLSDAADTRHLLTLSPGNQTLDLVYIEDMVNAFIVAAERLLDGEVEGHKRFSVSTGNPVRLKEIVRIYEEVTGSTVPVQWGGRAYREREIMVPWQGERLPGWKPIIELRAGIKLLFDHSSKSADR
jgi:nucleoside-diphosphate-sugar epimerase